MARAIVLDLALLDATGDERYWEGAVERARFVVSRLAPDPEHGAIIYLPGRLDPRNCSNSVIDSGECTGALATLLAHERSASLTTEDRALVEHAVEQNAETYLRAAVVEKEITNQRLWGGMGLAAAHRVAPRLQWQKALERCIERSIAEQRADGSWAYQPDATRYGAFAGAADTTVYYHGRCLVFLMSILVAVPAIASGPAAWDAVERGLEFLAGVTTPDGLKPLALEGKRWFWDGSYEAGSNAYDVVALRWGAERFGRPGWRTLGDQVWQQLARHQDADGGITACRGRVQGSKFKVQGGRDTADFVCRDFHTADLAWTAQLLAELPDPSTDRTEAAAQHDGVAVRQFDDAGVVRLEGDGTVALIRTAKRPRNTQFGGAVGGGGLCYAGHLRDVANGLRVAREQAMVEGEFVAYPRQARRFSALRGFFKNNPLGREGRQWLFVARLLVAQRRPIAALARLWRGLIRPLLESLAQPATSHWATSAQRDVGERSVSIAARPAESDGRVPRWAEDAHIERNYTVEPGALRVTDHWRGGAGVGRLVYLLPAAAHDVAIEAVPEAGRRGPQGREVYVTAGGGPLSLTVRYRL